MIDDMRVVCVMLGGLTTLLALCTIGSIQVGDAGGAAIGGIISTALMIACLKAIDNKGVR